MLNTLFPPIITSPQPTRHLTPTLLHEQRESLSRYMNAVEQNGIEVLESIKQHGRNVARGDIYGWRSVFDVLQLYVRAATTLINECAAVKGIESIPNRDGELEGRKGSKNILRGSGPALDSGRRPSAANKDKPLPERPGQEGASSQTVKGGSVLDKLARKFHFLGHRKKEDTEKNEDEPKTRSVRKAKSTGNLRDLKGKNHSCVGAGNLRNQIGLTKFDDFDYDELRKRTIEEARARAAMQEVKPKSRPLISFEN